MPVVCRKSLKTRTVWVYLLIDPRDQHIRYAGQAAHPKSRLRAHISAPGNPGLSAWIQELNAAGLEPIMQIVGKIRTYTGHWWIDEQIRNGAERQLIRRLDAEPGSRLLNIAWTKRDKLKSRNPLTSR